MDPGGRGPLGSPPGSVPNHKTTLNCQKCLYIVTIHTHTHTHSKLTYFDHHNENINHPDLRITRI